MGNDFYFYPLNIKSYNEVYFLLSKLIVKFLSFDNGLPVQFVHTAEKLSSVAILIDEKNDKYSS